MHPPKQRKTLGLALGSGGIRGLAHVGVIRTLLKHDIPIDFIAGASIGAWVGAHYALFQDLERLEEFTVNKKEEKLRILLEPSFKGGLVGGERTRKLLTEWLEDASFEETKIPLSIVATDLYKRESVIFSSAALVPAVQASMAIPGLFKPVSHHGRVLVDGGVTNPVPSDIVKKMGADVVLAVSLDRIPGDSEIPTKGLGMLAVANRTIEIMRYYLAKNCVHSADLIVEPLVENFASWSQYFRKDVGQEVVHAGEQEMEKYIPELKKLLGRS
jgi:NTE family protein